MSVIGTPSEAEVAEAWEASMEDILEVKEQKDIPELNKYQCGTYKMHSLEDAKKIASTVLKRGVGVMNNDEIALDLSKVN